MDGHAANAPTALWRRLLTTTAPAATILIRLLADVVFLSEGIQKFLFPELLGVGRFTKIGIPAPEVTAPFVGVVEISCGFLLLVGLLTRLATIPLIIDMIVAILSTKVPILLGHGYWLFSVAKLTRYGFWSMMSEARTDWSMLTSCLFLLLVGAGTWSIDTRLTRPPVGAVIGPAPPARSA